MRNTISKAMITGLAALSLAASAFAAAQPAAAADWHAHVRGGWHGGGGWLGPAIIGGLAAGALAAPYYGYGNCYQYAPVYDAYGRYIGQRLVNVCS